MIDIDVLEPGLLSSVQAGPRTGLRHLGVGAGGALDGFSWQVGNALLGNPGNAASLEFTLRGPTLRFPQGARIALTGADVDAFADGEPVPGWRAVALPAGCTLRLGACRRGARGLLAVAGGLDVRDVLGSASTDLRAGFGGLDGRALRTGDRLRARGLPPAVDVVTTQTGWIDPHPDIDLDRPARVRLLPGADALATPTPWRDPFRVAATSNRQGLRLEGTPLAVRDPGDRLSSPVIEGSVQLPPDGKPIVLLADAQTVGGYPCIGHVVQSDLPRLAQLRPGDRLQFETIDAGGALALACGQRQRLARISLAIEQARRLAGRPGP
ncbi:biotin-dependent carboxyltransferase family protein [Arenimonas donghaensis]|uniref:Carboxyltransferase domain-containing protein n=1 Tax=Arenimonas donghaensis DSM 18148 = HO3-R19 TaxID=1121014 RepID=A0A087MKI6_9GAMM|nr:biotin-dependent carboxyltransferase family protein [Arenimonas donghaensis]KFL37389.1 hypothetical protein N788_09340 [Arenimonas donghaensis DSM 18148 = HO3-R19]